MTRLWPIFKQRLTKLVKFHGVDYLLHYLVFSSWTFRNILPELSVSQLLEDVGGKYANQCWKCLGNRSVINCKLISFCELDIV